MVFHRRCKVEAQGAIVHAPDEAEVDAIVDLMVGNGVTLEEIVIFDHFTGPVTNSPLP